MKIKRSYVFEDRYFIDIEDDKDLMVYAVSHNCRIMEAFPKITNEGIGYFNSEDAAQKYIEKHLVC